jgi:hypothetical protein
MAKDKNPLDGVVRFIANEGYGDDMQALMQEHVVPGLVNSGLAPEALPAKMNNQIYAMMVTCIVEDLMTRQGKDGRNVTDAYMKRHGWKQSGAFRRTLQAIRDSKFRLWEVIAVTPGVGLKLRDLLAPAVTVDVITPGLAGVLPVGCPVGLRVLELDGQRVPSGGVLPFDEGMSAEGAEAVKAAAGNVENIAPFITSFWLRKTLEEVAEEEGKGSPGTLPPDPVTL